MIATAAPPLPPGKYQVHYSLQGRSRVAYNGSQLIDGWTAQATNNTIATITVSDAAAANEFRIEAEFVADPSFFPGDSSQVQIPSYFEVEPLGDDANAMLTAGQGVSQMEGKVEEVSDQLSHDTPTAGSLRDLGFFEIRAGRFADAEQHLGKSIQLDGSEHFAWYWRGCVSAYLGHTDAYRSNCSGMFKAFAGTSDQAIVDRMLKTCLLLPSPQEPQRLMELANGYLLKSRQTSDDVPFAKLCHALACYRCGDNAASLTSARACEGDAFDEPVRTAAAETLVAMAAEHLSRHDQAVAALRKARSLVDRLPRAGKADLGNNPEDWLICHVLLQEAEHEVRP